jgi:hypothetical protein
VSDTLTRNDVRSQPGRLDHLAWGTAAPAVHEIPGKSMSPLVGAGLLTSPSGRARRFQMLESESISFWIMM